MSKIKISRFIFYGAVLTSILAGIFFTNYEPIIKDTFGE